MGDPTPKDPLGNARTLRNILERLRVLEQARPLQTAFNDASAAQSTANTAQGAAQQASSDAATANQNASAASSAAQTAQQQAQAAQTAAASKTKTTWSTVVPDNAQNPGTTDGDTWYVTNGTGGNTTAQYRWNAATLAWTLTPIDGAVLRNVIADTVKAGAVDGQTITGATIRSAGSGQRVEMLQTRMDIYNSANTLSGRIIGGLNDIVSGSSLLLRAFGSTPTGQFAVVPATSISCSVTPAPFVSSGYSYSGSTFTSSFSSVAEGIFSSGPVSATEFWCASGTTGGWRAIGRVNQSTPAGSRVILGGSFERLSYTWTNPSTSVRTDVPVMTGDPYGDSANVYLTATDFRLPDGTSISADTGWVSDGFTTQSGVTVTGAKIRRIGNVVSVLLDNVTLDSINIPTTGDVANRVVIKVPTGFAPTMLQPLSSASAGAMSSFYINSAGNITLAATVPDSTQTGNVTKTSWLTSCGGTYFVG